VFRRDGSATAQMIVEIILTKEDAVSFVFKFILLNSCVTKFVLSLRVEAQRFSNESVLADVKFNPNLISLVLIVKHLLKFEGCLKVKSDDNFSQKHCPILCFKYFVIKSSNLKFKINKTHSHSNAS